MPKFSTRSCRNEEFRRFCSKVYAHQFLLPSPFTSVAQMSIANDVEGNGNKRTRAVRTATALVLAALNLTHLSRIQLFHNFPSFLFSPARIILGWA